MNAKIEKLFLKVFSEKNLKKFEKFILFFATAGFIIHLTLILLNNNGILNISFGSDTLLQNPISAIYTPFSFILVYEAFLLIYYLPRSFTTSVGKQYEIMSLILIRKIFKDIPEVNLDGNWLINHNNVQLIYDLSGILLVFFLILIFRKLKERLPQLSVNKNLERFINYKRIISLILVPVLTTLCLISFFDWYNGVFSNQPFDDNLNYLFFIDFFTILILVDVFILLISFQYTERYSQLIRNTGFIISTILLRLSFSATGLTSIILLVSGIAFGVIILAIYNQMEKVPKTN
ncbi:MAG: hypothetical protein CND00_03960 [Cryomorphaceae bacterium MED-G14]|nr:MAG: hypothetical protein CND00_03960 [Cryomorphaceae bacterium MED-G14]|tara:strand:+ start:55 stop:927 length:873 start_codon:yes stop_codon:yes gene_type:complete